MSTRIIFQLTFLILLLVVIYYSYPILITNLKIEQNTEENWESCMLTSNKSSIHLNLNKTSTILTTSDNAIAIQFTGYLVYKNFKSTAENNSQPETDSFTQEFLRLEPTQLEYTMPGLMDELSVKLKTNCAELEFHKIQLLGRDESNMSIYIMLSKLLKEGALGSRTSCSIDWHETGIVLSHNGYECSRASSYPCKVTHLAKRVLLVELVIESIKLEYKGRSQDSDRHQFIGQTDDFSFC